MPIGQWLFEQHVPRNVPVRGEFADLARLPRPPRTLADRIRCAVDLYPCDVLLVHRDADGPDSRPRFVEICDAHGDSGVEGAFVCVVPVRETEAWLLFDEGAIRRAAGNPNGRVSLSLPSTNIEAVADPKQILLDALRTASELRGRRLKRFRAERARSTLANLIEDFEPLRELDAFQRFEEDVLTLIHETGVATRGE